MFSFSPVILHFFLCRWSPSTLSWQAWSSHCRHTYRKTRGNSCSLEAVPVRIFHYLFNSVVWSVGLCYLTGFLSQPANVLSTHYTCNVHLPALELVSLEWHLQCYINTSSRLATSCGTRGTYLAVHFIKDNSRAKNLLHTDIAIQKWTSQNVKYCRWRCQQSREEVTAVLCVLSDHPPLLCS